MTIISNISSYAQSTSQASRLRELREQVDTVSRQATTQQKYETYAGYGTQANEVLNLNNQQPLLQSYISNIDTVSNRMTTMTNAMSSITTVSKQIVSSIQDLLRGGSGENLPSIQQIARQGLSTVESLMNSNIDGHYLFSGGAVDTPAYADDDTLNANVKALVDQWLSDGDTDALTGGIDALSGAALGFSPKLATSGNVTARVDDNLDVDYTLKADNPAFSNMLRTLSTIANLAIPDPADDVANIGQYTDTLSALLTRAQGAGDQVDAQNAELAGKFNLVKTLKAQHQSDLNLAQTRSAELQTADPTEALVKLQALQTQLTASYQVTNIISKLSLVNFMD